MNSSNKMAFFPLMLALVAPTDAHHSINFHFNPDTNISIEGVVKEFKYQNPHSELFIDVLDENGVSTTWRTEMTASSTLNQQGWTAEHFLPGQEIKITGYEARRDQNTIYLRKAEFVDGTSTSFTFGQVVNGEVVGDEVEVDLNVLGNWVRANAPTTEDFPDGGPGSATMNNNPHLSKLTEVGLAASENYNVVTDDPNLNCELPSILRAWRQPDFSPTNISQNGDLITIQHEIYDLKRVIYLNQAAHPAGLAPSRVGHSIARYEGDELIIETTGFIPGVLIPHEGILHSEELRLTERFSVDEQTGLLTMSWIASDPIHYREPLSSSFSFARSENPISEYDCQVATKLE